MGNTPYDSEHTDQAPELQRAANQYATWTEGPEE